MLLKTVSRYITTNAPLLSVFTILIIVISYPLNSHAADANKTRRATWSFNHARGLLDDAKKLRDQGKFKEASDLRKDAIALIKVDPDPAIFLDGRITITYDSSLLSLEEFGWFGEWGLDPSLPAPPLNIPPEGFEWFLQAPNPELAVTVQNISPPLGSTISTLQVDYNWGDGLVSSVDEEFNFFGLVFEVQEDITFGDFISATALVGNNLASEFDFDSVNPDASLDLPNYNRCIPPDFGQPTLCGVPVSEPSSTIGILALGILGGGATLKRKLKSANSTEK